MLCPVKICLSYDGVKACDCVDELVTRLIATLLREVC